MREDRTRERTGWPCRQCGKVFVSRQALHVHRHQCDEQMKALPLIAERQPPETPLLRTAWGSLLPALFLIGR